MKRSSDNSINPEYNAGSITVLRGLEAVRQNPGMYIGDTDSHIGLRNMFNEVLDNAIDEHLAGFCNHISIIIHHKESSTGVEVDQGECVTIIDDGRGIPIDIHKEEGVSAVELIMTTLHAGSKFDNNVYKISGGLHGVGISVVNALSSWLEARIWRDGGEYFIKFQDGIVVESLRRISDSNKKRGTSITFKPSSSVFSYTQFDHRFIQERVQELAFLNSGLRISLEDKRATSKSKTEFCYQGGIKEFVSYLDSNKEPLHDNIVIRGEKNSIVTDLSMQWNEEYTENVHCFTNNIRQKDGGTHLTGFRAAVTRSINSYLQNNDVKKTKKAADIESEDIREGLTAVLSMKVPDPKFSSQTKDKLISDEVRSVVECIVSEGLCKWLEENPKSAKLIIEKIEKAARDRNASKKALELSRKKSSSFESHTGGGKLANCQNKDPSKSEIFLVEGASAGGSAKQARDKLYQAILALKGKILNTERARQILNSEEIRILISVLGAGIGKEFDISKLRYHKIVIMTDADVDGAHIRILLITFFFRNMIELIKNGYIYIAQPPLYKLRKGSTEKYLRDDTELRNYLVNSNLKGSKIISDGIEYIEDEFRNFILKVMNLTDFITKNYQSNSQLYEALFIAKDRTVRNQGMSVDDITDYSRWIESAVLILNRFDNIAIWSYMLFDESCVEFYKKIGDAVFSHRINLIDIDAQASSFLRHNASLNGAFLHNPVSLVFKAEDPISCNLYSELVEKFLEKAKKGVVIQRFKGLGEMNPDQLWETTLDPQKRNLKKLEIYDINSADNTVHILMGDSVEPRKNFIQNNASSVENIDVCTNTTIFRAICLMIRDLNHILIRGAKQHNLKNITVAIPRYSLSVITGVSGSGKSSLAFDVLHGEASRLYVGSIGGGNVPYQTNESNSKPDVESIVGLSPTIAIDQKTTSKNPRSTVATMTEIYDFMRLLFARIGIPYSPYTGLPITSQTPEEMLTRILSLPKSSVIFFSAPIVNGQRGEHKKEIISLKRQGYKTVKINGNVYDFDNLPIHELSKTRESTIEAMLGSISVDENNSTEIFNMIRSGLEVGDGILEVEIIGLPETDDKLLSVGKKINFSKKFACPVSGFCLAEIEPRMFSFNSPYGACKRCDGLGFEHFFSPSLIISNPALSIRDGAIEPWSGSTSKLNTVSRRNFYQQTLESLSHHYGFSLDVPFERLSPDIVDILLYGTGNEKIEFDYSDGNRKSKIFDEFEGIIPYLTKRFDQSESAHITEELNAYRDRRDCSFCKGYRLREEALCVKIDGLHIGEVCAMSIRDSAEWFKALPSKLSKKSEQIADRAVQEIVKRMNLLINIGLEYLTLSRRANTLSGGEGQRIRLASQTGAGLCGVIYVLDEPSIGLHQSDNDRLLETLKILRDLGNTVIVVEHDEDTMKAADYLIDIGPGAGIRGGEVVSCGTPNEVIADPVSVTGAYLSGAKEIYRHGRRQKSERHIVIKGASEHNLQNIDVKIPLEVFAVVSGVSGSGKSTLVFDILCKAAAKKLHGTQDTPGAYKEIKGLEYIDKIIEVDQSAIGRTPRSNPATYTNVFTPIREWFAMLPQAKAMGYNASRFSFNVKGGRCETCEGDGVLKIEMHFLPDIYVACEECNGKRYNKETLQVQYNGVSISDVLSMTIDDASEFFKHIPLIQEKLVTLQEVGLGYIHMGQPATTLSGGEAQRIKLSKELSKRATGRTLYIFDEPTTGLHFDDINKLLKVLNKLIDAGNSVLVIEHNMNVIERADYIIDFGPYGGNRGGQIVAHGTLEEIIASPLSQTGIHLARHINRFKI